MTYQFKMSIGDWSGDGHGEHEDFVIDSNKPVEAVREAHFKIKGATGIDIEDFCAEYEDGAIPSDVLDKLGELGYEPTHTSYYDFYSSCARYALPSDMAGIWMFLLMKADPELKLKFAAVPEIPTLHFYGYDEQRRHIEYVGYGLFS